MFLLVPGGLLLYLFIVGLSPELAKLVKLLNLRVLHLDYTVFALSNLFTLIYVLLAAIATTTPRAVVAVVSSSIQSIEFTIAELAIWLVLDWSSATVAESDGCDKGRVQ